MKEIKELRTRAIDFMLDEITADYNGLEIIFRHDLLHDKIDIKLDDNFAKCNGYQNLEEMLEKEAGMKQQLLDNNLGKIPEWLTVAENGDFLVQCKTIFN
jgi:hypothetical protein